MDTIKKQKSTAFGKKVYLLGVDKDGDHVWLEEPTWDCGWYWGLGYVRRYTYKKNPKYARDITSHTHFEGGVVGLTEVWNSKTQHFDRVYVSHINESSKFKATVFTDSESWLLSELMKSCYLLKETAAFFGRGGVHITKNPLAENLKNVEWAETINKTLLPQVFKQIERLLDPELAEV